MNHPPPPCASFGEELKRERLLRDVSLEEISGATKISMRLLSALEAGNLARLPAPVFTRGFIRAYCLHLGLDPVHKINAYLESVGGGGGAASPAVAKPGGASRFLRGRRSTAGTVLGGVTSILLLLGLIASPENRRGNSARIPAVALAEPVSFKNVAPSNEPTPLIRQDAADDVIAENGVALVLDFYGSSWIEIAADGRKLFDGLVNAGESRRFEAQKTFSVTFGNAGAVRVTLDGRALPPLGRPGEVVRRVLPEIGARG